MFSSMHDFMHLIRPLFEVHKGQQVVWPHSYNDIILEDGIWFEDHNLLSQIMNLLAYFASC